MAIIIPNEGELAILTAGLVNCSLNLFSNNVTPTPSTQATDLTIASFNGYLEQLKTFSCSTVSGQARAVMNGGDAEFTFTAPLPPATPQTIYGWWLENLFGTLLACGRFSTPYVITGFEESGTTITMTVPALEFILQDTNS